MANTNNSTPNIGADTEKKTSHSRAYSAAAILLAAVTIINMLLVGSLFTKTNEIYQGTSNTMQSINHINSNLLEINSNVLKIVSGIGDPAEIADNTILEFDVIHDLFNQFESVENRSDATIKRYNSAKTFILSYEERLNGLKDQYNTNGPESLGNMNNLYTQYIQHLQVTATEMLTATIDVVGNDTAKEMAKVYKNFYLTEGLMLLVLIVGEVAIFFIARYAKKSRLELEAREKMLAEVDAKLKNTRQKASSLAVTNILTGLKNRYGLDTDISERLETDKFSIAVFDLDNFRSINDTYGYDFGDEYLASISEKLKEQFSSVAEIYIINGHEFCFVFNKDIYESQVTRVAQDIMACISSPYVIFNLSIQLPASGVIYNYLPGDCQNTNTLLVKLDNSLRNVKRNGGNQIGTVVDI